MELPDKCLVLLYTDGLTDAVNAGKEHFGQERLLTWLTQTAAARPVEPRNRSKNGSRAKSKNISRPER